MGWRHVFLGLLVEVVRELADPLGGALFPPTETNPLISFLDGGQLVAAVSMVYCVLVADEAFEDGVPALRAYGLAVIALAAFLPIAPLLPTFLPGREALLRGRGAPWFLWWSLVALYEGSLGVSIYAYWRVTQRAMRRAQAAETERVRNEQRVQAAKLLALQSRVEPQMLFDALGRIGELHAREPWAADALLTDLIALLRAMLPGARADNSTVEREFALVDAWLRVARNAAHGAARVQLRIAPDAQSVGIAPMLVLPLLRSVLVVPYATQCEWTLDAKVAGDRLIVSLQADANASAAGLLAGADLSSLRERLAQLFGRSARFTVSSQPPALTLDLPRLHEDPDGDHSDR
jgi:hypothetical protein